MSGGAQQTQTCDSNGLQASEMTREFRLGIREKAFWVNTLPKWLSLDVSRLHGRLCWQKFADDQLHRNK
jgi:hypothetical protein